MVRQIRNGIVPIVEEGLHILVAKPNHSIQVRDAVAQRQVGVSLHIVIDKPQQLATGVHLSFLSQEFALRMRDTPCQLPGQPLLQCLSELSIKRDVHPAVGEVVQLGLLLGDLHDPPEYLRVIHPT